jgi:SAM-dependent methyltransferase
LTPENKANFERFVRDYEVVRAKEGWGSPMPDYYLALPFKDLSNKHGWIWRIRAQTLLYMQEHALPKIDTAHSSTCRVLDIGAGNGWLSYRLSQRGYHPIAVDLLDNDVDGLGAARHYLARLQQSFPRFQADMNHLPFDSGQFDVAIFNASFHYSSDYEKTLREALRCLRRPGIVVVADSPFYWREESGKQMLEERRVVFEKQFGIRSDSSRLPDARDLKRIGRTVGDSMECGQALVRPALGASSRESPSVAPTRAFEVLPAVVQSGMNLCD